jgi:hypothetical protein
MAAASARIHFQQRRRLEFPSNPAAPGSAITIFIAAPGLCTLSNGYAVTAASPDPLQPLLAANDPDLASFTYPAQTGIQIAMGPVSPAAFINSPMASHAGIFVSIQ